MNMIDSRLTSGDTIQTRDARSAPVLPEAVRTLRTVEALMTAYPDLRQVTSVETTYSRIAFHIAFCTPLAEQVGTMLAWYYRLDRPSLWVFDHAAVGIRITGRLAAHEIKVTATSTAREERVALADYVGTFNRPPKIQPTVHLLRRIQVEGRVA